MKPISNPFSLSLSFLLFVGLTPIIHSQTKKSSDSKAIKTQPSVTTKPNQLQFRPTQAQHNRPRVKAARESRQEDIRKLFTKYQIEYPPRQVLLRIFKQEDLLELWVLPEKNKSFVRLKDYAICAKSGDLGPKRRRGDLQVPEGFYQVTHFNSQSTFHLALLINYPNASDRIRGHPKNPGGDICIHGDCVTIGCIPLTDRWIQELYLICLDSKWRWGNPVQVHIFPTRLDQPGIQRLEREYSSQPNLVLFWKELQKGYQLFEQSHLPPRFFITKNGAYRFLNSK